MQQTDLSVRKPGYGDRKHWTLQQWKILHTGGWSMDGKCTSCCTGLSRKEEYRQRSPDVPFLQDPLLYKPVSPRCARVSSSRPLYHCPFAIPTRFEVEILHIYQCF